jgi:hypothetical protein
MKWTYNDGGRKAAGYKGSTDDCVCRAFAIAIGKPYKEVYNEINRIAQSERTGKRKKTKSSARTGVYKNTHRKLAKEYGFMWIPTMKVGEGCKMHLTENEIPSGTIIVSLAKHLVCVKNGIVQDTYNSSEKQYYDENGNLITNNARCVYGYYKPIKLIK